MRFRAHAWSTALLLASLALPLAAQTGPREFRVNVGQDSKGRTPVAAFAKDGGFLVVWSSDRNGLVGRTFTRSIRAQGPDRVLVANQNLPNTFPAEGDVVAHKEPAVVLGPGGDFLVFWTEEKAHLRTDIFFEHREVTERDILGQRFSRTGNPIGNRFRVNVTTAGFQSEPRALVLGTKVVVVWQGDDRQAGSGANEGLFGRVLDARGVPAGGEFRINAPGAWAFNAALAADAAGGFLVAWDGPDADSRGIFARFYDASAKPRGAELQVNTSTTGPQQRASMVQAASGDWLVLWQGRFETPRQSRVYGQVLSARGAPVGGEVQVSQSDRPWNLAPIAVVRDGGFRALWLEWTETFPIAVYGVDLDANAAPVGDKTRVSERPIGAQYEFAAANDGTGRLLLTWEGYNLAQKPGITAKLYPAEN